MEGGGVAELMVNIFGGGQRTGGKFYLLVDGKWGGIDGGRTEVTVGKIPVWARVQILARVSRHRWTSIAEAANNNERDTKVSIHFLRNADHVKIPSSVMTDIRPDTRRVQHTSDAVAFVSDVHVASLQGPGLAGRK